MSEQLTSTKTSFWEVITTNTIVIPQIQRDYAQGRIEPHVNEIRVRILERFFEAINKSTPIDIDFVYGYNSDNKFIPLDGQQRLTTLFLLHWYIAKRAKANNDLHILKKFRYETRRSSTDFCNALIENEIIFAEGVELNNWIVDQRWFFHSWKKDPTIIAMLTMIRDIHMMFKDSDFEKLWENICESNPITFNFLPIDDSGLTDELYIKMNSRGKPLTRFENFKVWFEKKYPNNWEWQKKIDNEWTNLFWNYRDTYKSANSNDNSIDDEFMQFINGMLIFSLALKGNKDDVHYFVNNEEIPFSKYEDKNLGCFSESEVISISKTLDWLCKHNSSLGNLLIDINYWQSKSIFELFLSHDVTYSDRARFYSLVHFINCMLEEVFIEDNFVRWMQVSRNLIENTTIDSPETFVNAIKAIDAIGNECLDINKFLGGTTSKISFFLSNQVEEEKVKISLVNSNSEWARVLLKAENHELFRGCISFLLINKENEVLECFKQYSELAFSIFNSSGSISEYKNDYLLIRAVLTKTTFSENIRLLENGENWRNLLKRDYIQKALYQIINELNGKPEDSYRGILEAMISNFSEKRILWKYYIIKNKTLLTSDASRSKAIKKNGDYFYLFNNEGANWINNDNQFLLSTYRNELITKILQLDSTIRLENSGSWWVKTDSATNATFYRGEYIWLKKSFNSYNLWFQFKQNELIVGYINNEKDNIKISDNDFPLITNWLLAKSYSPYPNNESEFDSWIDMVIKGIPCLENLASSKI